jgi:hypothetical protein
MPNYATKRAHQSGRAVLSISGLHGIGTSSIALVLEDAAIANEIAEMAERNLWFQAVVKVTQIKHDVFTGSQPVRVTLDHLVPLQFSDKVLAKARKSLQDSPTNSDSQVDRRSNFGVELPTPFTPEANAIVDAVKKYGAVFDAINRLK